MILSTLSCSLCLRLEKNKYTFGSVGVFHQQDPCTWSLPCLYEQDTFWETWRIFQLRDSIKRRTWIYEHKYTEQDAANAAPRTAGQTKNIGDSISRGADVKVHTLSNDAPKGWRRWKVLSRRLRTLDPCRRRSRSSTEVAFPDQEGRPWCSKHRMHNQWIFFSEDTLRHRIWRQNNGRSHLSAPAWNHVPATNIHSDLDDFQVIDMGTTSTIHPSSLENRSSTLSKLSSILEMEKSTCTSPLRRYAAILLNLTI